jgi:hypothetical protein
VLDATLVNAPATAENAGLLRLTKISKTHSTLFHQSCPKRSLIACAMVNINDDGDGNIQRYDDYTSSIKNYVEPERLPHIECYALIEHRAVNELSSSCSRSAVIGMI